MACRRVRADRSCLCTYKCLKYPIAVPSNDTPASSQSSHTPAFYKGIGCEYHEQEIDYPDIEPEIAFRCTQTYTVQTWFRGCGCKVGPRSNGTFHPCGKPENQCSGGKPGHYNRMLLVAEVCPLVREECTGASLTTFSMCGGQQCKGLGDVY